MRPEIQERKSVQPASELHSVTLEKHYSVPEIAELWAMSENQFADFSLESMAFSNGEPMRVQENEAT